MTDKELFIFLILGVISICTSIYLMYQAWIKKNMHPIAKWYITIVLCLVYIGLAYVGYVALTK
jgi:H+/Cl- antiporter ClcA